MGGKRNLIFKIGDIKLFTDPLSYIVKDSNERNPAYLETLEESLEEMLDRMTKKHLSKRLWCDSRQLLNAVHQVRENFWAEVEKYDPKKKGRR